MAQQASSGIPTDTPTGWRIWQSDADRLYATRQRDYTLAERVTGAARTVDGDDLVELCRTIAEQESMASSVTAHNAMAPRAIGP
jgi:hypothetical protein